MHCKGTAGWRPKASAGYSFKARLALAITSVLVHYPNAIVVVWLTGKHNAAVTRAAFQSEFVDSARIRVMQLSERYALKLADQLVAHDADAQTKAGALQHMLASILVACMHVQQARLVFLLRTLAW